MKMSFLSKLNKMFFCLIINLLIGCNENNNLAEFQIGNSARLMSSTSYFPLRLSYQSILNLKKTIIGTIVFDTDNLALRYFDGLKWDFCSNLKGNSPIKKNLINPDITKPDNITQIGWYNNNFYVAKSLTSKPYWLKVEFNIETLSEITLGNQLEKSRIIVSNNSSERFAHDSKLLCFNGKGYLAYYANDDSDIEGDKNQVVRLSVFNLDKMSDKKNFDVFKPNFSYSKIQTNYLATYTPVIFLTKNNNIRILARLYVDNQESYYYRDFNPILNTFSEPRICRIKLNDGKVETFTTSNVEKYIDKLFPTSYKLQTSKNFMFIVSESVFKSNFQYLGLTIGEFTGDKYKNVGTTLLIRTGDDAETFELLGAPNPGDIDSRYNKQFVEGSFDFTSNNEISMLGRNDLCGLMVTYSIDGGKTFSKPISLNDEFGYNTKATKPLFKNLGDGRYLTMWNIQEDYFDNKLGYGDRTVLDIRIGTNKNIVGNKVKARIRSYYGCHYPSIGEDISNYYITLTGDYRRITPKNVGDISITKISKLDLLK